MRIRQADASDQAAWDAFVKRHPDGLAYHYYGWKTAVERAYGFRGSYLLAEQAGEIQGILPLIHMKSLLFAERIVSLPYCDVGGCLALDEVSRSALLDGAKELARRQGAKRLELRWGGAQVMGPGSKNIVGDKVRMILELPSDSATLLAGLKAKLRSQVKKPIKDGLQVRVGGTEMVGDFYLVFAENMRALGSPVHSRKWIEAVVEAFTEMVRVAVVYTPAGSPAAGGIILMHPTTVSIPWASSLRRYNRLNPNMLLYWTFLALAADGGHSRFDFGRSTVGEGTFRFKEQWGAKPAPLFWENLSAPEATGAPGTSGVLAHKGRRAAEMLWTYLPLGITTLLGPSLRRNISL